MAAAPMASIASGSKRSGGEIEEKYQHQRAQQPVITCDAVVFVYSS